MILKTTGADIAEQAVTGGYVSTPYSKLDCQAFVEQVLKDLGVRKPDGTPYNWKGSNSMWRNHITWKGTIEECRKKYGEIPLGAFLFLLKWDGGEEERGYHDGQGNATHVGLYLGTSPLPVMDSSKGRGRVDYCKLSVFTHVGLMDMVDYYTEPAPPEDMTALEAIGVIRSEKSSDEEMLEALKTLTKFFKEVTL